MNPCGAHVCVCVHMFYMYMSTPDMRVPGHIGLTWGVVPIPSLAVCESVPVNVPAVYSYLQAQLSALAAV